MPNEKLKQALELLHKELALQSSHDPELQELANSVSSDIDTYLENQNSLATEQHGFAERVDNIATEFSIEHPNLYGILQELKAILFSIGA